MKTIIFLLVVLLPCLTFANEYSAQTKNQIDQEKLPDDPTKVATKVGFSYTDKFSISGSISLGPARKINVRIGENADEWRLGGSWLFDFGIVNVNFGRNEYEHGSSLTHYSIGSFVPLTVFGISPFGWQIFPMAGYTYNDGELATENNDSTVEADYVLVPSTSNSAYVGAFALKPLTEHWTLMTFGGGSMGSDDYSGYWLGGGTGYKVNKHHSFNVFAFVSDNSYGKEEKVGASYTYQFN